MFDSAFPATFPALAIAHFVALLSPGQDFFLITGHAIRHRLRGSWGICLGIALGNGIYILAALLGWNHLQSSTLLRTIIELGGGLYLTWIGWQLLHAKPGTTTITAVAQHPGIIKQLILGLNSALLNPKNAFFYMSLMSVVLGRDITPLQQTLCGTWMVGAVLLWDLCVAAFISHPRLQTRLYSHVHRIEQVAGIILLSFAALLFSQTLQ